MSIMDMHEGPHLSSVQLSLEIFSVRYDKKAIAGTKQTKKPPRDGSLKGDNTDWLILGFDPQCEIIWCNRTIIFLLVGCVNIASPAMGRFCVQRF